MIRIDCGPNPKYSRENIDSKIDKIFGNETHSFQKPIKWVKEVLKNIMR